MDLCGSASSRVIEEQPPTVIGIDEMSKAVDGGEGNTIAGAASDDAEGSREAVGLDDGSMASAGDKAMIRSDDYDPEYSPIADISMVLIGLKSCQWPKQLVAKKKIPALWFYINLTTYTQFMSTLAIFELLKIYDTDDLQAIDVSISPES